MVFFFRNLKYLLTALDAAEIIATKIGIPQHIQQQQQQIESIKIPIFFDDDVFTGTLFVVELERWSSRRFNDDC